MPQDPLQNELVKRAMARDAQAKIGALEPTTQEVYPQRENPFSSPDLMNQVMNLSDKVPGGSGMQVGMIPFKPDLEPFMVELYKRRLAAEPWLATHPGLSQVPEFQEAFRALYPNKKIVTAGTQTPSLTARLAKEALPPAASSPEEAVATASLNPGQKAPRMASSYTPPNRRLNSSTLTEDGVRKIRQMATTGQNAEQIASSMGMSKAAIEQVLRGESFHWVK